MCTLNMTALEVKTQRLKSSDSRLTCSPSTLEPTSPIMHLGQFLSLVEHLQFVTHTVR